MRRAIAAIAAVLCMSIWVSGQTADELLSRMTAARGGIEKIKAIQSMRETGKVAFGPESENNFIAVMVRPNKLRIDVMLPNGVMTQAFDGKMGWQTRPGADTPFVMDALQARGMSEQADFDGPLIEAKKKGNIVESAGLGEVEGRKTYVLKVTLATGSVHFYELDAESYLPVRWRGTRSAQGREIAVESIYSDFREVAGVKFPFVIESFAEGKLVQQMQIESREVNVTIDNTGFAIPAEKPTSK